MENLVNPNFDCWDKKKQLFSEPTENAIHNNAVLSEMKSNYQYLVDTFDPPTGKELFELYDSASKVEAKKEITFGEYLETVINEMKHGYNKKPSRNYQVYIGLKNKLIEERKIINVPLSEIGNKHFISFGQYILSLENEKGRTNYMNIMKQFKAVHNRAFEHELNDNMLRYKFSNDAPIREAKKKETLDEQEYLKFVNMDLSTITLSCVNSAYYILQLR